MRKVVSLALAIGALALSLLLIIGPIFYASADAQAVVNGGFESGLYGLPGWTILAYDSYSTAGDGVTNSIAHTGSYSFTIMTGTAIEQDWSTPFVPSSDFTFYVTLIADDGGSPSFLVFFNENVTFWTSAKGIAPTIDISHPVNGWVKCTIPLSSLPDPISKVKIFDVDSITPVSTSPAQAGQPLVTRCSVVGVCENIDDVSVFSSGQFIIPEVPYGTIAAVASMLVAAAALATFPKWKKKLPL